MCTLAIVLSYMYWVDGLIGCVYMYAQRTISISIHADAHNYIRVHIHVTIMHLSGLCLHLAYYMYLLLNTDSGSIITKPLKPHSTCIGVLPLLDLLLHE